MEVRNSWGKIEVSTSREDLWEVEEILLLSRGIFEKLIQSEI